jgi:DNA polymerase III psi subunit
MNGIPAEALFTEELYNIDARTVVVTSVPWQNITSEGKTLLEKILQAVRLSTDAITIVQQPILNIAAIRSRASRVIYFGPGTEAPLYEVSQVEGVSLIISAPLDQLHTDPVAKQKLWAGLKVLFSR